MAASSENLAETIDPFLIRQSFSDYGWPAPREENETLTNALQQSVFGDEDDFNLLFLPIQQPEHQQFENRSFSPFSSSDPKQHLHRSTHPTPSALSASDHEATATPAKRATTSVNGKARITKRKSRATKKNQTTFFTADPANFRQMVQQVTGIRLDASASSSSTLSHLLKPETRRPVGRFYNLRLPTLDTSSYLLDRHRHHHQISQSLMSNRPDHTTAGGFTSFGASQSADGEAGFGATDGLSSFPTLESWKVM